MDKKINTQEAWKDIEGYEGFYQVSNFGRVKSLARTTPRNYTIPERIKSNDKHPFGYPIVDLYKNNVRRKFRIHRLVAVAFMPNPENKREVNHIDNDPTNCRVDNLEWATPSENCKHSYKTGFSYMKVLNKRKGAEMYNARPVIQMDMNEVQIKIWSCISDAARFVGGATGDICAAINGRQKSSKGYKWKYAS